MIYIWFFLGLIIIVKASDVFLDSSIWIARTFKIPEFIIGATVVSLCTVLPEAVISISASSKCDSGLAFGTSAGSVVCNTALILALGIILNPPMLKFTKTLKRNCVTLSALIILLIIIMKMSGGISRGVGIALVLMMFLYLADSAKRSNSASVVSCTKNKFILKIVLFILSAAAIAVSSHILVDNGQKIAEALHVPNMIIGLTLTSVGSSLPELVTCVTSIKKGAAEIAIGNVLGADILNLCLVIGASATVNPMYVNMPTAFFALCVALCCVIYLYFCFARKNHRFYRFDGVFLLCMYVAYITASTVMFSSR